MLISQAFDDIDRSVINISHTLPSQQQQQILDHGNWVLIFLVSQSNHVPCKLQTSMGTEQVCSGFAVDQDSLERIQSFGKCFLSNCFVQGPGLAWWGSGGGR